MTQFLKRLLGMRALAAAPLLLLSATFSVHPASARISPCRLQLVVELLRAIHLKHDPKQFPDLTGFLAIADVIEEAGDTSSLDRAELIRTQVRLFQNEVGLAPLDPATLQLLIARNEVLTEKVYAHFHALTYGNVPKPAPASALGRIRRTVLEQLGVRTRDKEVEDMQRRQLPLRLPLFLGFLGIPPSSSVPPSTLSLSTEEMHRFANVLAGEPIMWLTVEGRHRSNRGIVNTGLTNVSFLRLDNATEPSELRRLATSEHARNLRGIKWNGGSPLADTVDALTADHAAPALEQLEIGHSDRHMLVDELSMVFGLSPRPRVERFAFGEIVPRHHALAVREAIASSPTFPNLAQLRANNLFFGTTQNWAFVEFEELDELIANFVDRVFANYARLQELSFNVPFLTPNYARSQSYAEHAPEALPVLLPYLSVSASAQRYAHVRLTFVRKPSP